MEVVDGSEMEREDWVDVDDSVSRSPFVKNPKDRSIGNPSENDADTEGGNDDDKVIGIEVENLIGDVAW